MNGTDLVTAAEDSKTGVSRRGILIGAPALACSLFLSERSPAVAQDAPASLLPSPGWTSAMPSGPDARAKFTGQSLCGED